MENEGQLDLALYRKLIERGYLSRLVGRSPNERAFAETLTYLRGGPKAIVDEVRDVNASCYSQNSTIHPLASIQSFHVDEKGKFIPSRRQ